MVLCDRVGCKEGVQTIVALVTGGFAGITQKRVLKRFFYLNETIIKEFKLPPKKTASPEKGKAVNQQ